jgi:tRNA(Ile)-lysidine synthase
MANTRKWSRSRSAPDDLVEHVRDRLIEAVRPGERVVLGYSGGIDSTVLLHVLARLREGLAFELTALHVNHHLSTHADAWAHACRGVARALGVACRVADVSIARGASLERAAREARYAALRAEPADCIVLAHNLDDQAETVLHQLLRGAGAKGLAGMPFVRHDHAALLDGGARPARILRPLLAVPRAEIERYAAAHALAWVEDESNANTAHTRNWLRHDVLPQLERRVPAVRSTLARAAANMAEAAELLDDLARMDAAQGAGARRVSIDALRALSVPRAKNLLRFLIGRAGWPMPSADRLAEGVRQALAARRDAAVRVDLGACELRRHAGFLHLLPRSAAADVLAPLAWNGEEAIAISGWGTLTMTRTHGEGLSAGRLALAPVTIRSRAGGERLQPHPGRPRRTVKNLLQEANLPPWERERLPYIYCGASLVCVPGVALDFRFGAAPGEPAIVPVWRSRYAP